MKKCLKIIGQAWFYKALIVIILVLTKQIAITKILLVVVFANVFDRGDRLVDVVERRVDDQRLLGHKASPFAANRVVARAGSQKKRERGVDPPSRAFKIGRISELSLSGFDDSALGATRFGVRGTLAVVRLFNGSTRFSHYKLL